MGSSGIGWALGIRYCRSVMLAPLVQLFPLDGFQFLFQPYFPYPPHPCLESTLSYGAWFRCRIECMGS
jgi:hypothetical protein